MEITKTIAPTILFSLFLASCSTTGFVKDQIAGKGSVLKEYQNGNDYYMIVKEGNRINKYRLYNWSSTFAKGTQAEIVYSVDTLIQSCAKGALSQAPIDCDLLKRDSDLKEHIAW